MSVLAQPHKLWCGDGAPGTHVLILAGEAGTAQLVDCHYHAHDILSVHEGRGQHVSGLVVGQLICEGAEVGALWGQRRVTGCLWVCLWVFSYTQL